MKPENIKCTHCGCTELYEYVPAGYPNTSLHSLVKEGEQSNGDIKSYVCANCFHVEKFFFAAEQQIAIRKDSLKRKEELTNYAANLRAKCYGRRRELLVQWWDIVELIVHEGIAQREALQARLAQLSARLEDENISVKQHRELSQEADALKAQLADDFLEDVLSSSAERRAWYDEEYDKLMSEKVRIHFTQEGRFNLDWGSRSSAFLHYRSENIDPRKMFPKFSSNYDKLISEGKEQIWPRNGLCGGALPMQINKALIKQDVLGKCSQLCGEVEQQKRYIRDLVQKAKQKFPVDEAEVNKALDDWAKAVNAFCKSLDDPK